MNAHRAYHRTQNETASRERLMVLLFEAAQRHMRTALSALQAGKPMDSRAVLAKAIDIVSELSATLDTTAAPQLAPIKDVYAFVCDRLLKASTSDDEKALTEAERAFTPLVEAFSTAVAQVSAGQPRAAAGGR